MSSVTDRKMVLEDSISSGLSLFFDEIIKDYKDQIVSSGIPNSAYDYQPQMKNILYNHYKMCIDEFSEEERDNVYPLLVGFALSEAGSMSEVITDTTESNIQKAYLSSNAQAEESLIEDGEVLSNTDKSIIGAAILSDIFKYRTNTISISETQTLSEPTRLTYEQIKAGIPTTFGSYIKPNTEKKTLTKEWVDQHDGEVRPTHVVAGGQTVDAKDPFIVGGSRLMYPRDKSLGAELKEVIHCRCYARYKRG